RCPTPSPLGAPPDDRVMATAPRHALNPPPPPPPSSQAWAGEEQLVREAILMVATNGAPRVLVAGITFGEQILDPCRRAALDAGAGVRARPTPSEGRLDLVIESVH